MTDRYSSPSGAGGGVAGSSAEASTTTGTTKPEIPWAFIDCPSDTLVVLIAHMLDLLCQHNDQVVLTPDALTRFHSRAPPNITVIDYLRRIVKYTNLEKIPLLSLLAYIDLTCQNLPTFTLSSLTVHRFLIAGVTAGSKAQCDVFCTNSHYAKVGGIKVGELNSLEREFLRVTGWALCCNADLLQRYYTSLIRSHGGFTQAQEPEVLPFLAFHDAGKPAPVPTSEPVTPAVTDAGDEEDGDEEIGEGEDGAEAGGVDDDVDVEGNDDADGDDEDADADADDDADDGEAVMANGIGVHEFPTRGRPPHRDAMEVDSPEVAAAQHQYHPPPPATAVRDSHLHPPPQTAAAQEAAHEHAQAQARSSALKSFVGGIFKRSDSSPRVRSRPLSTVAGGAAPGAGVGRTVSAPPGAAPGAPPPAGTISHPSSPAPLTPRVRTRDERSVDSLRGGIVGGAAVDDGGKRRARVE